VSLAEVAVRVNVDVSSAVMVIAHTSGSGSPLVGSFKSVIKERTRILQLDLRDDDYWWSTRLYLVASRWAG